MTLSAEDAALVDAARDAAARAYAPYSGFHVGAAVRAADGRVFAAANIENASYGLSLCAETNAVMAAVHAGAREIVGVAVLGYRATSPGEPVLATPCGRCRQIINEFAAPATPILVSDSAGGEVLATTLGDAAPPRLRAEPPRRLSRARRRGPSAGVRGGRSHLRANACATSSGRLASGGHGARSHAPRLRAQEVEVAAVLGLQHLVEVELGVAAGGATCSGGRPTRRGGAPAPPRPPGARCCPAGASRRIMSPVRTRASGPPSAASGEMCRTIVPNAVPLMRASEMRTMSFTPAAASFFGIGRYPASGIPGPPLGPAF